MTVASGSSYAAFVVMEFGRTLNSISDGGNNFTLIHNSVGQSPTSAAMGYLINDSSSGSITYTASFDNTTAAWIVVHEMTGVTGFDTSAMQLQGSVGSGTDAITSGNITVAGSGYLFGGTTTAEFSSSPTLSAGTNYTLVSLPFDVSAGATEYRVVGLGGTHAATFTQNLTGIPYITGIMAFGDGGGGGGPANCNLLLLRVGC